MGMYTADEIGDYLKKVIVSRFNDHLGEHLTESLTLQADMMNSLPPSKTSSGGLFQIWPWPEPDLLNSITPPPEFRRPLMTRAG
jgi:hypothetical protein